jgi:hypothetical protein
MPINPTYWLVDAAAVALASALALLLVSIIAIEIHEIARRR